MNRNGLGIGITTPNCKLQVIGAVNICNQGPYAVSNNYMQAGSLTIGDIYLNYGGGTNWNSNTAGLMMECLDNTEIAVHDSGQRLVSLIRYIGGGTNVITLGRDMYWGTTPVQVMSYLYVSGSYAQTYNLTANTGNAGTGYTGAGLLYWGGGSYSTVVAISYSGSILIGIYCFYGISARTYMSISDRRIQTNIKPIEDGLSIVNKLKPVEFDYIVEQNSSAGFIAQELYDVYPKAVHIDVEHIPNILEEATMNGVSGRREQPTSGILYIA